MDILPPPPEKSGKGPPLQLTAEELAITEKVMMYLYNHPDEDQNTGQIKKIRHFSRLWVDPTWMKTRKKEIKVETVAQDKQALEKTGIRQTRKRKKEFQDSYRELMENHKNKRVQLHPVDFAEESSQTKHEETVPMETDTEPKIEIVTEPADEPVEAGAPIRISTRLPCYVCKKDITLVHYFYDQMCPACGDLNFAKRNRTANLKGKVALLTGGRIKIGYEVGVKLLRAGAFVILTSRFQNDTITRYSREPDFLEWKDRLHVYALDMRLLADVEAFVAHILKNYNRLDIIINNAAQTIRRPPVFYSHLLQCEREPLVPQLQNLRFEFIGSKQPLLCDSITEPATQPSSQLIPHFSSISKFGSSIAELSQVPLLPEDKQADLALFPPDQYDEDGQQVDLRTQNSWVLQLSDVSTVEAAEVHIVNALAPFILNAKLKPLMTRTDGVKTHIINVSSMEGKFSRTKKSTHPHTNMAKAAMNMMTRTSAGDYALCGIMMNSVDTGWITYENPCELTAQKQALGLEPPIDCIDGAARILDPIWEEVSVGTSSWGLFFKDYLPTKW